MVAGRGGISGGVIQVVAPDLQFTTQGGIAADSHPLALLGGPDQPLPTVGIDAGAATFLSTDRAVSLGPVEVAGSLQLTTLGAVSQSDRGPLIVDTLNLTSQLAGAGVQLGHEGNLIRAARIITQDGDVTLRSG
ncbi:MAG: hypothetical protein ACKOJF_35070, partial [Planctomycetaceae bacterium]